MARDCKNYERTPAIAEKVQHMDREIGETKASSDSAHKRLDTHNDKLNSLIILTESTSDAILGHMKKEEGMYVVLGWLLAGIAALIVSFMTWSYVTHTDKMVMLGQQQVMIESNQKMIIQLVADNKNHKHK